MYVMYINKIPQKQNKSKSKATNILTHNASRIFGVDWCAYTTNETNAR